MKQDKLPFIKNIVNRVTKLWESLPFRLQGKIMNVLPILAILISTSFAFIGNNQRENIEAAIQRHFQMTSGLSEVLTLTVNAETGMRGYLLTKNNSFLQPFLIASNKLPKAIENLKNLAETEPGLEPRLEKISRVEKLRVLIKKQMDDLSIQKNYKYNLNDQKMYKHLVYGKSLMDQIRNNLNAINSKEGILLSERVQEINSIRKRDYMAIFLTLTVAILSHFVLWYFFKTGILSRIKNLTENVRSLREGIALPFEPSGKKDDLGELEQEVIMADKQFSVSKSE